MYQCFVCKQFVWPGHQCCFVWPYAPTPIYNTITDRTADELAKIRELLEKLMEKKS